MNDQKTFNQQDLGRGAAHYGIEAMAGLINHAIDLAQLSDEAFDTAVAKMAKIYEQQSAWQVVEGDGTGIVLSTLLASGVKWWADAAKALRNEYIRRGITSFPVTPEQLAVLQIEPRDDQPLN